MSRPLALSKLRVQGVVGAEVRGRRLLSCSLAPSSLTIPSGVTEIADYCFSGQDNLIEVYLVNDVTKVGRACFANCPKLVRIVCNPCLKEYERELKSGNHATVIYREG